MATSDAIDPLKRKLNSMAFILNELSEQYLTSEIGAEDCAFQVHERLQNLPTPPAPEHLRVLAALNDWCAATLITAEQKQLLQQRVIAASRSDAGAGSSGGAGVGGSGVASDDEEMLVEEGDQFQFQFQL